MEKQILAGIENPAILERLYRSDKRSFKRAFNSLLPEIRDVKLATFWQERLSPDDLAWGSSSDKLFVVAAVTLAGIIAKLPELLLIDPELFYPRNIGFIVFPLLTAYFGWKHHLSVRGIVLIACATLASLVYINLLPDDPNSDTLILARMHLVLFLWSLLGIAYVGKTANDHEGRLGYLRYNGEWVVLSGLIVIAGFILSGVTIGLFSLIGFKIEVFYFNYVGIVGAAAAPIIGSYLTHVNPQLTGKISTAIARIFGPVVLVMLVAYLIAILYSGKDPYNDREFLLMFNVLLVGVMAIIFFSVAESSRATERRAEVATLFLLSIVTIIVNGIALSAIVFRISEWGITPNRAAVLGANLLILVNLLLAAVQIGRVLARRQHLMAVGNTIASYLPVYFFWTMVVTFLFPVIFGFR